jgi:NADH-quinone oxidoreductase subunit L
MFLDNDILLALIVILPFTAAAIIPALGKLGGKAVAGFAVIAAIILAALVFLLVPDIFFDNVAPIGLGDGIQYDWIPSAGIIFGFHIDPLSLTLAIVASAIGALAVIYSLKYMDGQKALPRYYSLVLLFIGSMVCLVFTNNLLILYLFWEVIGLCSYGLIGFYNQDPKAAKAGIKAFVVTRVGDIGLLIGIFILYLGTGTFNIQEIIASPPTMQYLAPAAFLFILGAMGKSAQVPLHVWLPDAMEAPTTVSALIHAATLVNSGIYILARMSPIFFHVEGWGMTLLIIGGITALMGAIMACVEPDLKKLLAYSTISQLGYMVFALGIIVNEPDIGLVHIGILAATFHLLNHAVFKALLFLGAGSVIHSTGTRNMNEMGGLKKTMKITHVTMLFGTLALAGIVPFSGFWSKDLIFAGAWEAEMWLPLAVVVLTAILTVAYSFRMYYLVFQGEPRNNTHTHESPAAMTLPLILLAIGAIGSWALIGIFSEAMHAPIYGFEGAHVHELVAFLEETFTSPAVLLSFMAMAVGLLIFLALKKDLMKKPSNFFTKCAAKGFYFDALYNGFISRLRLLSMGLRKSQTGDANMNAVGIAMAFLLLFIFIFVWGVF